MGLLKRHRLRLSLVIAIAVVLFQITEEVLEQGTNVFDHAVLMAIHDFVPVAWVPFFDLVTLTGSAKILVPVVGVIAVIMTWRRHRVEALQLALSTALAGGVIYAAKTVIGRQRPDLWDTQWFWGSSFPSGHTLSTAAVATALCLIVRRIRPELLLKARVLAVIWVFMVGLSRLVLGVHWPTDVAAAACAGFLVATLVEGVLSAIRHRSNWQRSAVIPFEK